MYMRVDSLISSCDLAGFVPDNRPSISSTNTMNWNVHLIVLPRTQFTTVCRIRLQLTIHACTLAKFRYLWVLIPGLHNLALPQTPNERGTGLRDIGHVSYEV